MKTTIKIKIILGLLLFALSAGAHSPDVSTTLLVEESKGKWVLQIRAALTAFEYEIENHFGTSAYSTPEEFQELVIKHVRQHVAIETGLDAVNLENGMVKLGHETSVTYQVSGIPDELKTLTVTNSSFKNIHRNQSGLIVLKKGFSKNQFKLENRNEHTADLKISNFTFEQITPQTTNSEFPLGVLIGLLLVPALLFGGYKWVNSGDGTLFNTFIFNN